MDRYVYVAIFELYRMSLITLPATGSELVVHSQACHTPGPNLARLLCSRALSWKRMQPGSQAH